MRNRFSVFLTYLVYGLVVLLMGLAVILNVLKPQRPLTNADIPQETIGWFQKLIDGGWSDIGGILGPDERDPADWTRYEDIDSMNCIEDEYFVIYYSKKDSVVEKNKALVSLRYAHEAVPIGDLFMKGYPYPSKLSGRKLPVYLAKTVDDFRSICKQLGHGDPGTWAIGLYCFQYSISGVYTDGVIISPEAWSVTDLLIDDKTEDKELKRTLWHEMNHFMYFSNWDYAQASVPNLWFTEGLAEYFAENFDRLRVVGNHRDFDLTKDFMDGSSEYWVGMSAFLSMEQQYSKNTISEIVSYSYKNNIDKAVQMSVPNENLKSWNTKWHSFMENKEYRKYSK